MVLVDRYKLWAFAVMLFTASSCFADVEHFYNSISGAKFAVDSSVKIKDDKFLTSFWGTIQQNLKVTDVVTLQMNEDTNLYLSTPKNCTVDIEVTYTNVYDVVDSFATSLSITFDTNRAKPFNYKTSLKFQGGYSVTTRILSVSYGGSFTAYPKIFTLSEDIYINRIYKFNCDSAMSIDTNYDGTNQRLVLSWAPFLGADDYDLEFTTYDHLSELVTSGFSSVTTYGDFDFIFRGNATRVTLSDYSYAMSLVYDTGYVFYRIRPIHYDSVGNRIEGAWSSNLALIPSILSSTISSYPDKFAWRGHEPALNWQYTAAYAEDGKRKEVTSYYDGTLRNRQSVTLNNTENKAIVGETMYDHQGRAAVTTLPAPIDSGKIVFYDLFNVNSAGKEYSRWDFDTGACNFVPPYMDSLLGSHGRGSSGYYSSSNPDVHNGFNAYLPDAQGYPFTETQYTPDNTGRISSQSIAGKAHTLGSNHETKYYYGKPSQEQLDRLFGSEVGNYSHYLENMVIDANGQISVSYVDANGKTVATALAGQPPSNLSPLPSYYPADSLTINLLDGNYSNPDSITSTYGLLATNAGKYFFSYKLLPDDYIDGSCTKSYICDDCLYDVLLMVTDGCGADRPIYIKHDTNFSYDSIHPFDTTCKNKNIIDTFTLNLQPGNYNITRIIKVDAGAINYYTQRYLSSDSCLQTYQDFYNTALLNTDFAGCGMDCQTCLASLGADTTFVRKYITALINAGDSLPSPKDTSTADSIYASAVAQCNVLCQPPNQCLSLYDQMLADVSLGGQYCTYDTIGLGFKDTATDIASVLIVDYKNPVYTNSNNVLDTVIINGIKYLPSQLNRNDFIHNWKPCWADSLVKYHPEYCYYAYCQMDTASNRYDYDIENTNTFAQAASEGFINPVGNAPIPFTSIIWEDPYFVAGGLGYDSIWEMKHYLDTFATLTSPSMVLTAWQAAALSLTCEIDTLSGHDITFLPPATLGMGCVGDNNMEWNFFRGIYLAKKQAIQNSLENYYVSHTGGCSTYATCIGQSTCPDPYDTLHPRHLSWASINISSFEPSPAPPAIGSQAAEEEWYNEHVKSSCDTTCQSYATAWLDELKGCGTLSTADQDSIVAGLVEVCEMGCNSNHPMGSNSTMGLIPDSRGDRDFEDVILRVTHEPRSDVFCDSLDLTMPLSYLDSNGVTGPPITYYKPDSCVCYKLRFIDSAYYKPDSIAGDTDAQDFAHYLNTHFGGNLTDSVINELISLCNSTTCFFMPQPVELPIWLTCCQDTSYKINALISTTISINTNYTNLDLLETEYTDTTAIITINNCCINCTDIAAAYRIFILRSPAGIDTMAQFPTLLASYLNQTFNFNLTYEQYMQFYKQCIGYDTSGHPIIGTGTTGGGTVSTYTDVRNVHPIAAGIIAPLYGDYANLYLNNPALAPAGTEVAMVDSLAPDSMPFTIVTSSTLPNPNRRSMLVIKFSHSHHLWDGGAEYNMNRKTWRFINTAMYANRYALNFFTPAVLDGSSGKMNAFQPSDITTLLTNTIPPGIPIGSGPPPPNCDSIVYRLDSIELISGGTGGVGGIGGPGGIAGTDGPCPCPGAPVAYPELTLVVDTTIQRVPVDTVSVICGNNCDSIVYTTDTIVESRISIDTLLVGKFRIIPTAGLYVFGPVCIDTLYRTDTTFITVPKDTILKSCHCDTLFKYDTTYTTVSILTSDFTTLLATSNSTTINRVGIDTVLPYCLKPCDSIIYRIDTIISVDSIGTISSPTDTIRYTKLIEYVPDTIIYRPCCDSIVYTMDTTIHKDTIYKYPLVPCVGIVTTTGGGPDTSWQYTWTPIDTIHRRCLGPCDSIVYTNDTIPIIAIGGVLGGGIDTAGTINTGGYRIVRVTVDTIFRRCLGPCDSIIYTNDTIPIIAIGGVVGDSISTINTGGYRIVSVPVDTLFRKCLGPCDSIVYRADTVAIGTSGSGGDSTTSLTGGVLYAIEYVPVDTIIRNCPPSVMPYYLCNQPLNTPPYIPPVDTNPCLTQLLTDASYNAQNAYNQYLDSITNAFTSNYISHCMNIDDSFHLRMPFDEYHYTLYYYDQAENLVKTIPPQGVHPITSQTLLNHVKGFRNGTFTTPTYPIDSLDSRYWFNSLNSPIQQHTPDGDTTHFWYDRLGRLVLSQNAVQKPANYSYTLYDPIGRIMEVGQLNTDSITGLTFDTIVRNDTLLQKLIAAWPHVQITHTFYDSVAVKHIPLIQQNLRKRISSITYTDLEQPSDTIYDNAIHYTYDVDGNVATILEEECADTNVKQAYKRADYFYDLVSGKVNQVDYQRKQPDFFMQAYEYDADNRITNVMTSTDSINWEQEAAYQYYSHGPLAREVIGRRQVQGIDYAYTLNGWIKAVNSSITNPSYDMGRDGDVHDANSLVARDAYGFSINYYTGDYRPIGASNFEAKGLPTTDLYNGNIAGATYSIKPLQPTTMGYTYSYDQLNRIVSMLAFNGDTIHNLWAAADSISSFREKTSYDENGNILSYIRHGNTIASMPLAMDSLNYHYNVNANQLNWVHDTVPASNYPSDIDNERPGNYAYNAIGELASDTAGKIDSIIWNVYGKVQEIDFVPPDSGAIECIKFVYDPLGNRLEKIHYKSVPVFCYHCSSPPIITADTTKYIHDAQGNILAIYTRKHDTVDMNEWDIYGSKRIGTLDTTLLVYPYTVTVSGPPLDSSTIRYEEGQIQYELTNHLGNVLATVSDRTLPVDTNHDSLADYYQPDIINAQDYYPFGMLEPGRTYQMAGDSLYHFGFNNKLHDDDIYGNRNCYDYGMRFYDPRLGKFLSIDPLFLKFPFESNYLYAGDNPILNVDIVGKYKLSASDQKVSPMLTAYLKSGIMEVLKSPALMDALEKNTGFTAAQIKTALTWGKGPNLILTDRQNIYSANGETVANNMHTYEPPPIFIAKDLAVQLNTAKPEDKQAALLNVISVILHETTHYADKVNTDRDCAEEGIETGDEFEKAAYGVDAPGIYYIDDAKKVIKEKSGTDPSVLPTVPNMKEEKKKATQLKQSKKEQSK